MQRANIGFQENQTFSMSIRAISFKYIKKKKLSIDSNTCLQYLQKQKLSALQEVLNHSPPLKQNSVSRTDAIFFFFLNYYAYHIDFSTLNFEVDYFKLKA